MRGGDTYVITFDHSGPKPHLWVLLTEPAAGEPVILVSVTTLRHGKDQTVVLMPGDHPWVTHASSIFYGDVVVSDANRLQEWIDGGLAIADVPCSPQLLRTIRDGLRCSEFTPKKILTLINDMRASFPR